MYVAKIHKIQKNREKSRGRNSINQRQDIRLKFRQPKQQRIFRQSSSITQQQLKRAFYLNDAADCYNNKKCKKLDQAKKDGDQLLIMAKKGMLKKPSMK